MITFIRSRHLRCLSPPTSGVGLTGGMWDISCVFWTSAAKFALGTLHPIPHHDVEVLEDFASR